MAYLLTQTVSNYVGNGNSQVCSQEGTLPSKWEAMYTLQFVRPTVGSLPQRKLDTHMQREMNKNVHCTMCERKQPEQNAHQNGL